MVIFTFSYFVSHFHFTLLISQRFACRRLKPVAFLVLNKNHAVVDGNNGSTDKIKKDFRYFFELKEMMFQTDVTE